MWDCASQLWVPGRSRMQGRPDLSFCPITLQRFSAVLDEYAHGCLFEKGADWYSFCLGAGRGVYGGGPAQKSYVPIHSSWFKVQISGQNCVVCVSLIFSCYLAKPHSWGREPLALSPPHHTSHRPPQAHPGHPTG